MSKIDELIQEYCPEGVEFKTIEGLGDLYGGITGKSKDDFKDGNARFITYVNIFSNIAVDTTRDDYVKIGEGEKQRTLQKGDVCFTGSSENPEECGMSSVVNIEPSEPLYLNSFCFFFRPKDTSLLLPDFTKYLFRDSAIRKQINQTASGVTRFNISKKRFMKIRIPVPPLEVQKEIVKILDTFTQLEAELTAELTARKAQHEHYRNQLLTFDDAGGVRWTTIEEVASDTFWIMPATPNFSEAGEVPYITSKNIKGGHISFENIKRISKDDYRAISKNRPIVVDDILISMIGTIGEVARVKSSDLDFYGQNMYLVRLDQAKINVNYFLHFFDSNKMKTYFSSIKNNSGQGYLKANHIESIKIPLPSLSEQVRVASILDKFDALTNDISQGLPAEITARRQQYEYYRTKLLTFKELPA